MRRITKAAIAAAVCSVGVSIAQASDGDHKVWLCHATDSATNPWELIYVDRHGAEGHMKAGHGDGVRTDFYAEDGTTDCEAGPGGGQL